MSCNSYMNIHKCGDAVTLYAVKVYGICETEVSKGPQCVHSGLIHRCAPSTHYHGHSILVSGLEGSTV